ncbi:NfeD family protein [Alcanivorax quisquiliarum]|uniref:NfeD family protein n=1 Tax=Alcanivorax quisquiliarum TaxID=2933565 RepID=A0ABT0E343_9GAMM|nr:NfeD family protein [Alcanivorax quisquiliarum]MCK0536242.1 NfeD family protein [Alcanivorax quisquiliarum]
MFAELFTDSALWLLLGFLLIISELFVTGLVAVFFGIGAVVVGLLALFGLVTSLTTQLWLFGIISLLSLFAARRRFQRWLRGSVGDAASGQMSSGERGNRVTVLADFVDGAGPVQLRGTKWDAESTEPLKAGDSAWVQGNRGIVLIVSTTRP